MMKMRMKMKMRIGWGGVCSNGCNDGRANFKDF